MLLVNTGLKDTFFDYWLASLNDTKLGYRFVHRQCHNRLKTCFKDLKASTCSHCAILFINELEVPSPHFLGNVSWV
jgi:hypothetical protein